MNENDEPKSKVDVLEWVERERGSLDEVLAGLSELQKLEPVFEGGRSVKDLLVHISDWEQRMIRWVGETIAGLVPERPGKGLTWDDLDRVNEQTFLENKDRPLREVEEESSASYGQALRCVEGMTEVDLLDGERFAWREGAPLWKMVAANTWWHYREHREQVQGWLKAME